MRGDMVSIKVCQLTTVYILYGRPRTDMRVNDAHKIYGSGISVKYIEYSISDSISCIQGSWTTFHKHDFAKNKA